MELSPLARERLAKIGELTEEEKYRLKCSRQLGAVLADFFTNKISPEEFWKALKTYKEEGRAYLLPEAQIKLLDTLGLSVSDADFEKRCQAILAVETLKDGADYLRLEQDLKEIGELRRKYRQEMEETYQALKARVEQQVKLASQRLVQQGATQGAAIDIEGSVEVSTKATPEWKNFLARHESIYKQKFKDCQDRLRMKLQG